MKKYPKIPTVFQRDPKTKFKTLLPGKYATPELKYLMYSVWDFTEKVDGTNIRVSVKDGHLDIGGRTDNSQIPSPLLSKLHVMFGDPEELDERMNSSIFTLFGEGYGAKIQKRGKNYIPDGVSFVLFDIHIENSQGASYWLRRETVEEIGDSLNMPVVPIIGQGNLMQLVDFCSVPFESRWGNFDAEGIVARPKVTLFDHQGQRIITKLKCKDLDKNER